MTPPLKPFTITKLALGTLLLMALSSCLIHGEINLFITEKLVTTDVTTAEVGSPVTAALEVRGVWQHGALAASAVAVGRMELCVVRPADDADEICRSAPAGELPPGVTVLPGESLGKDVSLRLDRRIRTGAAVETHSVRFTSSVPQELILMTRYTTAGTDRWALDLEGQRITVVFEPID